MNNSLRSWHYLKNLVPNKTTTATYPGVDSISSRPVCSQTVTIPLEHTLRIYIKLIFFLDSFQPTWATRFASRPASTRTSGSRPRAPVPATGRTCSPTSTTTTGPSSSGRPGERSSWTAGSRASKITRYGCLLKGGIYIIRQILVKWCRTAWSWQDTKNKFDIFTMF
jgi:hypothetical protein